jgi:hypothetical protein
VEEVRPPEEEGGDTVVRMACLDDGVNGRVLEVLWEREMDARVLGESTWDTVGQRGFDDGRVFSSSLHTLQWNCITSTDPGLFQAPLRKAQGSSLISQASVTAWDALRRARLLENWSSRTHT